MRGSFPNSRARRRGQALLLAVLIMIFAALVSAAFIGVVSTNLNQTARQTDKDRAVVAARAGMDYVNRQLAFSPEGDKWRANPLPAGDPLYPVYYSQLDIAQGWAGQFAKFPDPRGPQQNGPQFLAKVERMPFGTDRAGSLKITVIGLSADDPSAWHRTVAYKGGYEAAPIAQTMRTVTNYDFRNRTVPSGQVATYTPGTSPTITVRNANIDFEAFAKPDPSAPVMPFTITFANPRAASATAAQGAVVTNVVKVAGPPVTYTFTLAQAPTTAPVVDDRVELAANIGAPSGIKYDNITATPINIELSDGPVTGGIRTNGGLWWQGSINGDLLRPLSSATATLPPADIQSSGMMAIDGAVSVLKDGATVSTTLTASSNSSTYDPSIVNDGWNRLKGGVPGVNFNSSTRTVSNFIPPDFTSGEGLERYRNMARFSGPANGYTSAAASVHGYGRGTYIDNSQDKERVPGAAAQREMTQAELTRMWLSPKLVTDKFVRTELPHTPPTTLATATTTSLETEHVRGWVGPDEFRARGVEIQLVQDRDYDPITTGVQPGIIVTRDPRSDNTSADITRSSGPVLEKAWNNENGNKLDGIYTQALPWPQNGVIFAEGNIRIRGVVTNAPRSLTVVSMNNIYIEDSLKIQDTVTAKNVKILLLAKRNVVLNPTRLLGRPDAETLTKGIAVTGQTVAAGTLNVPLNVADASQFKVGDLISTSTFIANVETETVRGIVTGVTATPSITDNDVITFNCTTGGTIAENSLVRTPNSKPGATASTAIGQSVSYSPITTPTDIVQRRFVPNGPNMRLAFNHGGQRKDLFKIETQPVAGGVPPKPASILLSNKRVAAPADSNLLMTNKTIRVAGITADSFPGTPTGTETMGTLATSASMPPHIDVPNAEGWQYSPTDFTILPDSDYKDLPYFYLAGIGNRHDFNSATVAGTEWRKNVSPASYTIPLATSISVLLNGVAAPLTNERYNGAAYDITDQFGFNRDYTGPEDILTGDQGFYQTDPFLTTTDTRLLTTPIGSTSLVIQQTPGITQPTGSQTLPAYRLRNMKVENVLLAETAGTAESSTVTSINEAYSIDVNAFVYAQTGSWFVLPGPMFDERLRGNSTSNFLDLNNNGAPDTLGVPDPGEYIDKGVVGFTAGDYADLNRDGATQDFEKYAVERYSRYNYSISFTGAIAENQTAIVNTVNDPVPTNAPIVAGAVDDWMNKWVTVKVATAPTLTTTHNRITYTFDESVVLGKMDNDPGFHLPQTLQLSYES